MRSLCVFLGKAIARRAVIIGFAYAGLCTAAVLYPAAAQAPKLPGTTDSVPAGVTVQLTLDGLVYADPNGMTLYWNDFDQEPGVSTCVNEALTKAFNASTHFEYALPYPFDGAQRRTCTQKWPPFEPAANAIPVGKWQISTRADGRRQWTYGGRPAYLSVVDRRPGETSATETRIRSRVPLSAPLHMPAGIRTAKTLLGLSLADKAGYVLYTYGRDAKNQSKCDKSCVRLWPPVLAAAGSSPEGVWSAFSREDGQKQLAYEGHPLYRYSADEGPSHTDGSAIQDWSPVIVLPVRAPPEGINIANTPDGQVYVDRNGMSVYQFSCNEETDEHLSCDREGDTVAYLLGVCGGRARCADTFRLIRATDPNAKDGPLWSVRSVDLSNPLRNLANESEGTKVWLYKKRLVFTYSGDTVPGEIYAHGIRQLILLQVDLLRAYGAPDEE